MRNCLIVLCFFVTSQVHAQAVVVEGNITTQPASFYPGSNNALSIIQTSTGFPDPTGAFFSYDGQNLTLVATNTDEGSDWYLVHPGDPLNSTTAVNYLKFSTFSGPVHVGTGDFYLGGITGIGFNSSGPNPAHRDVYGWAHLQPISPGSQALTMIDSAVAYGSPGIIVGTTSLVPEPASLSLGALFMGVLGLSRRRSRN